MGSERGASWMEKQTMAELNYIDVEGMIKKKVLNYLKNINIEWDIKHQQYQEFWIIFDCVVRINDTDYPLSHTTNTMYWYRVSEREIEIELEMARQTILRKIRRLFDNADYEEFLRNLRTKVRNLESK